VQDTLASMRLMTKRDTFIEADVMMNMLMWLEDWDGRVPMPAVLKPRPLWTGKQVGSVVGHSLPTIHSSMLHCVEPEPCDTLPGGLSNAYARRLCVACRSSTCSCRGSTAGALRPGTRTASRQTCRRQTPRSAGREFPGSPAQQASHRQWTTQQSWGPHSSSGRPLQCCVCARLQVLIQDGYLLEGTLCKKTLGASGGSLVHIIFMEAGPDAARAFLSQCQYTANYWLLQHGFSIGIGDTVADSATMLVINQTINRVSWARTAAEHLLSALTWLTWSVLARAFHAAKSAYLPCHAVRVAALLCHTNVSARSRRRRRR
jgi:DNA-directed RNA polymerase beta' subunit